jgi:hypothetical protein
MDPKEPKKPSFLRRNCLWIVLLFGGLFLLTIIILYILVNLQNFGIISLGIPDFTHPGSSNTTTSSSSKGNWTLTLVSPTSMTGPETSITGEGKSTITFQMPSKDGAKFTATGDWKSEANGTVGAGTSTGTVNGKISISGETNNGKLIFSPTYSPEDCFGNVVTPIGGRTSTTCDPNSVFPVHTVTIDIKENAKTTKDSATNYGLYSYDWKENWTLTKAK